MISPPPDSDLRRRMTIPNALTLLRILLVPVFGLLWLADHHLAALIVFLVAGGTDLLDGLLARTLNQRTRLGSLLDPAADKLTLLVAFLVGVSTGGVPAWLAALVIGRDLVLTLGVGIYTLVVHGAYRSWHPTRLGKYSTFYQLATIAAALLARATTAEWLAPWVAALIIVCAFMTVLSGLQYITIGVLALHAQGAPDER